MVQPARRAQLVTGFAAVYVLWGSTYLAVALGLRSVPPFLLMGGRSLLAAAILLGLSWLRTARLPPARAWPHAALSGLLLFAGCHGTLAYAQQRVPSGLAAILLATIPFWIALLSLVAPSDGQRPRAASLAAMLPGLAGVALIAWGGASGGGGVAIEPVLAALLLGAALSWAVGSIVSQRHTRSTPALALAGMQLACGGAALLAASAVAGEVATFSPIGVSPVSWAALAYLTLAGSVVAFTAYVWLLDRAPASLVATYTFVNPVIAVVLGWTVLGERPGASTLVGMVLIIGSVVAAWHLSSRITHHGITHHDSTERTTNGAGQRARGGARTADRPMPPASQGGAPRPMPRRPRASGATGRADDRSGRRIMIEPTGGHEAACRGVAP
jgi:drug/metabolite transporter (DMT)-like permease